jgi:iron complex outermembrane receptor protein
MNTRKRNKCLVHVAIFMIAVLWSAAGWAQSGPVADKTQTAKDYEVYRLGQVNVTADRSPEQQVAIITEITAEDIKAANHQTVAEALSGVPGVLTTTGRKNEPTVFIHGIAQGRILVLIDGVPYYETNYGKLDLNQIPTDNVARIEVIKGTASVLYGANALGGVINIVTKMPSTKPFTSASVEVGEKNALRASLTHGMKTGIFSYWLNYAYRQADGWNISNNYNPRIGTIIQRNPNATTNTVIQESGTRKNSDVKANDFWLKFGVQPSEDSQYFINLHYLNMEKGIPPSSVENRVLLRKPAFSQFGRIPLYQDWGIDFDGKQKIADPLTFKVKLFYHNHVDDYDSYRDKDYQNKISVSRFEDYILGGSLQGEYKAADWDTVRMSFHYKTDSHKERADAYLPLAESSSYTGSVGLENEFTLIPKLSVIAGVSYDWFFVEKAQANVTDNAGNLVRQQDNNKTNAQDFNPMIGLNYAVTKSTKLFGSVAQKTRFPSLQYLYSSTSGNSNLKAEKSINYILGASQTIGTWARAEASVFHYDIKDMISRDVPSNPLNIYQNFDNVKMTGFEISAEIYPLDDLKFRAGYTFNEARNHSSGKLTDHVVNVPRDKVDLGAQYLLPVLRTALDLNASYIGMTYSQLPSPTSPNLAVLETGDYFLMNGKITQPFLKHFEAYVAVKNILDCNYEPEYGYPGPGRAFWVGLTFKY